MCVFVHNMYELCTACFLNMWMERTSTDRVPRTTPAAENSQVLSLWFSKPLLQMESQLIVCNTFGHLGKDVEE